MLRALSFLFAIVVLIGVVACAAPSAAQETWPDVRINPSGQGDVHTLDRGPGHYLSSFKIVFSWIVFALWVWTTDWAGRDCWQLKQNYVVWNSVLFFPFVAAFLLLWMIPSFLVGFLLLVLVYAGTLGSYIYVRNEAVEPQERVLTPDHFRHVLAGKAQSVGVKIEAEKKAAHEKGAPVDLIAQGGATERDNGANLLRARQSPGFVLAKELIADAVLRRGEAVMLDFTREAVAVRYQIDGIWHDSQPQDRESGDVMLAVLKTLAALDAGERRKKQSGTFAAKYNSTSYACQFLGQGTETGERAILKLDDGSVRFHTLQSLGMTDKTRERLAGLMHADSGLLLLSAPPGGGLTTTFDVVLEESDRLLRDYVAVENVARREREIENIGVTTYNAAGGETPASVLPKLIRKYPNVIVVRNLADAETASILCDQVDEKRLVLTSIRAKEASEALLRVLMLKVPQEKFAKAVTAVLNQRLIRKLCEACKVAYQPSPEVLKKLGIPEGRVKSLYREPKPEEVEKVCPECGGIGYLGRTALFELLVVDDKTREVLAKQPKLELVKKAARQAGMRTLQEEAILMAARGVTSLTEMMRVLKQ